MSTITTLLLATVSLAATLTALLLAGPARAGAVVDPSGVSVTGHANGTFAIGCSTCGHYNLVLSGDPAPYVGGPGATDAAFAYSGVPLRAASGVPDDYTLGGSVSMSATAALQGALATPFLGAYAEAVNVLAYIVVQPDVPIGIDYYGATATASSTQRYTWTGASATTITFNFVLNGAVLDSRSSLFGSGAFYGDDFEFALAFGSDSVEGVGFGGPPQAYSGGFAVTLLFQPGDSFFLRATLSAGVQGTYEIGTTFADASHTLYVSSVVGGDTSLLLPGLAAVPEPATWAAWLAGLAALAGAARRRTICG